MMRSPQPILKLLIFLITVGLTGCPISPTSQPQLKCELTQPPTPENLSSALQISIYVDGTPSMQGYVNHPRGEKTSYSQTLDLLDRIFQSHPHRNSVEEEYYRLGERLEKINRQNYRDAQQSKFYGSQEYPLLKTVNIEKAIQPANEDKLTVIITDLYQASEDVNNINRLIRQNYLNANNINGDYAVGILAIKSEFNGDVYLEDGSGRKFPYTTHNAQGKKIQEFRPFYVIFLGKYSDITSYFQKISSDKRFPTDNRITIFSPNHFVQELSHVDGEPNLQNNSVQQIAAVGSPRIEIHQEKIHLFQVKSNSETDIPINYSVPLKLYNHTLQPFNNIKTETTVQVFDDLEKKLLPAPKGSGVEQSLVINQWQKDKNSEILKFVTTIKPSSLGDDPFYYFIIDAKAQGVEAEEWWSEWSSNNSNTQDWKTLNLEDFLVGLQASTNTLMAKSPPVIGRFCYGIKVR